MTLRIVVALEAEGQADELREWWDSNRPAAKPLEEEIGRVLSLIAEQPEIGLLDQDEGIPGLRTFPIRGTPYVVYYVPDREKGVVQVMWFWSRARGHGPSR